MSSIFIFQHAPAFGPGRLIPLLRDFGIPVQLRRLYEGQAFPADLNEIRGAVFLGGPMSVGEVGSDRHAFLSPEVDLMKHLIHTDRPTLAIGFGAQLLAHAAGAKVGPAPNPEFGWHPINLPFPGGTEPIVGGLSDGCPMFHWHADMFDIPKNAGSPPAPPGSALLCSTKACKNQAFRFKNRLFGFQFHFELDDSDFAAIAAAAPAEQKSAAGDIAADTQRNFHRYSRLGDHIVRNFVQFTRTY